MWRGITFYICFGRWAGFRAWANKSSVRIGLGFVSIAVVFYDVEVALADLIDHYEWMNGNG